MPPAGTLFVVATPIGNLEDLTFRALRVLKEVDLIAAEDTRRTSKLLAHYEVRKPLVSLREHNEVRETPRIVARLRAGARVALVSDAGTPAIADPGARLVRAARDAGFDVVPIPGPSAITAALSVSGLETGEFTFMGFPPPTGAARRGWLERAAAEERTIVLFEAPHRIDRTLADLETYLDTRPIHVHREISKMNESYGTRPYKTLSQKGEFTVVVEAKPSAKGARSALLDSEVTEAVATIVERLYNGPFNLVDAVSAIIGVSKPTAARLIKRQRFSIKRQNSTSA